VSDLPETVGEYLAMTRIAVIGAGLSGLVVAQRLSAHADVTVYEKSRGVGGRMATRYAGEYEFDHGAQFFTASTSAFREYLRPLVEQGVVANWPATFAEVDPNGVRDTRRWDDDYPHYVGTPRMNEVGKWLSQDLAVTTGTRIASATQAHGKWTLVDSKDGEIEGFDWLILTCPPEQTAELGAADEQLVALCRQREMLACYALMLGFEEPLELPWQAALVRDARISWISVNSSKPGRKRPDTLVVHATNAWAEEHIDDDLDDVRDAMLDEVSLICGRDLSAFDHCDVHRWRYANVGKQAGPDCYINDRKRIAACGDWFVRGRVEAAFTSADALARRLRELPAATGSAF
jgi:predicted NAD/FAD-dependent oxidoreductase